MTMPQGDLTTNASRVREESLARAEDAAERGMRRIRGIGAKHKHERPQSDVFGVFVLAVVLASAFMPCPSIQSSRKPGVGKSLRKLRIEALTYQE